MNAKPAADLLVRAERVRTIDPTAGPVTALAIRAGKIAATAGPGGRPSCGPR
jgi:predicted amidohydrolase YtcJ